jgi:N-acetylmuramic acid 6-phosphate etherase
LAFDRLKRRTPTPAPPTERLHPRSEDLDLRPVAEVVARLHAEDLAAVQAVGRVLPEIAAAAELAAAALRAGGRLIYVGAGTSGRLGALDAAECPPTFGVSPAQVVALVAGGPRALRRAVEGAEDDRTAGQRDLLRLRPGPKDLVIGITASSTTPYVLGALAQARRARARTALVCCNPACSRALAEITLVPDTGPELVAGSTRLKAGTATKLVLNAISTAAMVRLGKVYRGRMVDLRPTNQKLRARAKAMVLELTGLSEAQAQKLLARARGSPRLAVAMHLSGGTATQARALLRRQGLRELERILPRGPGSARRR